VREPTVFFLSDYGLQDEFVGVVHAVIRAGSPPACVIDLTHQIPPFDVRAGSHALVRAVPHLGPGVVLAVVDPGVGTARRGLLLRVDAAAGGPTLFVGPDNGLLIAAAECIGEAPIAEAFELYRDPAPPERGSTFDGRDLFAPAASALCRGASPGELGQPLEPDTLVRLFGGVVEQGRAHEGRACLRVEVTWVDRFGNVQLAATVADARAAGLLLDGAMAVTAQAEGVHPGATALPVSMVPEGVTLRGVGAYADLARGELGLLLDGNGHLAVVAREASAAHWLNVAAGELVVLAW
jgi:S-adenosyl-L-methionine hydrolase (adenosine-forming)